MEQFLKYLMTTVPKEVLEAYEFEELKLNIQKRIESCCSAITAALSNDQEIANEAYQMLENHLTAKDTEEKALKSLARIQALDPKPQQHLKL